MVSEESIMLSLKDCMDFCDLTESECVAIMNRAHVSSVAACALSQHINTTGNKQEMLKQLQLYIDYIETQSEVINPVPKNGKQNVAKYAYS